MSGASPRGGGSAAGASPRGRGSATGASPPGGGSCGRCDLKVVSDANTFFIETVLAHHGVLGCFSEIKTNPARVDADGRLRISPFHDSAAAPHGCSLCPENMCKGKIIEKIQAIAGAKNQHFIYIGDGKGDYCPCLKLGEGLKGTMSCQRRTTPCGTSSAATSSFSRLRFIHGIAARN